jgi:serine/threonine-protein kinase
VFSSIKTKRAIDHILSLGETSSPEAQASLRKLKSEQAQAFNKVIELLRDAPKIHLRTLVSLVDELVTDDSLKQLLEVLPELDKQTQKEIATLLNTSRSLDPNRVLPYLDKSIPLQIQIDLVTAHHKRLNPVQVLKFVNKCDPQLWDILFEIIVSGADKSIIPEAIASSYAKDPELKRRTAVLLSRFNTPDVIEALTRLSSDSNSNVRFTALRGLHRLGASPGAKSLFKILAQAEGEERKLIREILIENQDPSFGPYLSSLLLEGNASISEIVVDILPSLASKELIREMLLAIKEKDVWTREKVTDKLIHIDAPEFFNAFSQLANDPDDYIRSITLDALQNSDVASSGEMAVKLLLAALDDEDFMVREKAITKVAEIREKRAIPKLVKIAKSEPKSCPKIVQTLQKIGDPEALPFVLECLDAPEIVHQKSALECLPYINTEKTARKVRDYLVSKISDIHVALQKSAIEVAEQLATDFSLPEDTKINRILQDTRQQLMSDEERLRERDQSGGTVSASKPREALDDFSEGMVLENRYKLIREIGKGGYGSVWLVEDNIINDRMVMKFLREELTSDDIAIERFIRELRFARKLSHENIIRLHDYLNLNGVSAISMEYFDGYTLSSRLYKEKTIKPIELAQIALKIASGLNIAHKSNIVHRDLKPANIMLNEDSELKIVDFGIAAASKENESRLTRTGTLIGTPTYISPEQIQGREVDGRTDIYSLGIMMFEMATGSPPYKADDPMALIFQHIEGNAPRVDDVDPAFPDDLAEIIHKSIRPDPDERYQTIQQVMDDLQAFLQSAKATS